jgi:hypothetical protein
MSIEKATISNMWEIAAIVEVLERKGLCTKQDLYDIITESRRKNPRPGMERLVRIDYHGSKEVPTGTCHAILKAAGLKENGPSHG